MMSIEHKITVTDTDNPLYPLLVTCTCNYQCHCKTDKEADFRKRTHESDAMWVQASKGLARGHL